MSEDEARNLSLPGELVLLLHKGDGAAHTMRADLVTAAAEIGELALRERVEPAGKTKVQLLNAQPIGIPWLDEVLDSLAGKAGPKDKPVQLTSWLPRRRKAFRQHRDLLVEAGLVRQEKGRALGVLPVDRFYPDEAVRGELIAGVRQAAQGTRPVDGGLAIRCALVHVAGIAKSLGCDRAEVKALKEISKGNGLSEAVKRVIDASTAVVVSAAAAGSAGGTS